MRTVLIVLLVGLLSGCGLTAHIVGKTQERELTTFERIEVGGLVNVVIEKGDTTKASITASGIQMKDIMTKVEGDTLLVTTKGNHRGESIIINVTYQQLVAVKTTGAATIRSDGAIKSENLEVIITGNGDAMLELDVGNVSVNLSGGGNLTLTGKAHKQHIVSNRSHGSLDNGSLELAQ